MPKAVKYYRGPRHSDTKGHIIGLPGVPSIAWFVGALSYTGAASHSSHVQLFSLPVGKADHDYWSTIRNRLETGVLEVRSDAPYSNWQEAAVALYGTLAVPYIVTPVVETVVEHLVAAIEGAGSVEPC